MDYYGILMLNFEGIDYYGILMVQLYGHGFVECRGNSVFLIC